MKLSPVVSLFRSNGIQQKFQELLGQRATAFITSVLQIVSQSNQLVDADPMSVYNAAAMAATLDLPINSNLGFAYIIPYKTNQGGQTKIIAQFQLGLKGYIQLAQRSGQFRTMSATPVYKGQLVECDPLKGFKFDFTNNDSNEVIGYAAYFELLNGFEKTLYMDIRKVEQHATRYSKNYKSDSSLWKTDFDSMATKTVLKLLLSKFAPLSVEMQKAITADQGDILDHETMDIGYIDNPGESEMESESKEQISNNLKDLYSDESEAEESGSRATGNENGSDVNSSGKGRGK